MPAPNANPQVVSFCNEHVRTFADLCVKAYEAAKQMGLVYTAQGLQSLIGADPTILIADGSQTDGRSTMSELKVQQVMGVAAKIIAHTEETNADGTVDMQTLGSVAVNF